MSEDPIGLAGGINPYTFAGNDPINNYDPTGTECWRWIKTVTIYNSKTLEIVKRWYEDLGITCDINPIGDAEVVGLFAPGGCGGGQDSQDTKSCSSLAESRVGREAISAAFFGTVSQTAEHGVWVWPHKWRHANYKSSTLTQIYGLELTPAGHPIFIHGHLPEGWYPIGAGRRRWVPNRGKLSRGDVRFSVTRGIGVAAVEAGLGGGLVGGTLILMTPKGGQSTCKL